MVTKFKLLLLLTLMALFILLPYGTGKSMELTGYFSPAIYSSSKIDLGNINFNKVDLNNLLPNSKGMFAKKINDEKKFKDLIDRSV